MLCRSYHVCIVGNNKVCCKPCEWRVFADRWFLWDLKVSKWYFWGSCLRNYLKERLDLRFDIFDHSETANLPNVFLLVLFSNLDLASTGSSPNSSFSLLTYRIERAYKKECLWLTFMCFQWFVWYRFQKFIWESCSTVLRIIVFHRVNIHTPQVYAYRRL
jgi:hypothetical protein